MNTVEAIMLSQIPLVVVGILLWWEIRMIRTDFVMNRGYTNNPKNTGEDPFHELSKEASYSD